MNKPNIEQMLFIGIIVMMIIAIGPLELLGFFAILIAYSALDSVTMFVLGAAVFVGWACYKHLGQT